MAHRSTEHHEVLCKRRGAGARGDGCLVEHTSTSCTGAAVWSDHTETCTNSCPFFAPPGAANACTAGTDLASGCAPDADFFTPNHGPYTITTVFTPRV